HHRCPFLSSEGDKALVLRWWPVGGLKATKSDANVARGIERNQECTELLRSPLDVIVIRHVFGCLVLRCDELLPKPINLVLLSRRKLAKLNVGSRRKPMRLRQRRGLIELAPRI